MYEIRIVLKDGKNGECIVWDKIVNLYIDSDGVHFKSANVPLPFLVSWDKIKYMKVVKK